MEFAAGGRLAVRITAADVGKRVSVRSLRTGGGAGETFTDTVGVLTSWTEGVMSITRRTGEPVRIAEGSVVAAKVVPDAPARRRGPAADYPELARVAARAWPPVEEEALSEWRLRAAGGFTRRANSVLPLGDPGLPLPEALAAVRAWYARRGLPAYVQTATGARGTQEELCARLADLGWELEVTAELRIGALARLADTGDAGTTGDTGDTDRVRLARSVDEGWLRRYQRFTRPRPEVLEVLSGGPSVWFATVPDPDGGPVPAAIGRCVVDGRWAGFMAVEVAPEQRRRGLGTAVMAALARQALTEGAGAAWLQVERGNPAADALYEGLGFRVHHTYHHHREP
ncbi:GNAT family N-acetyltransferase [Streptomyces sp. NPDC058045]|uniref:GNAT family N-acetyltransferase n=1 Tax=Streptomyces sp. NPDC058045 TaxID=3346311 RepID=UPI0036F01A97